MCNVLTIWLPKGRSLRGPVGGSGMAGIAQGASKGIRIAAIYELVFKDFSFTILTTSTNLWVSCKLSYLSLKPEHLPPPHAPQTVCKEFGYGKT